jgi:hypothetical protein
MVILICESVVKLASTKPKAIPIDHLLRSPFATAAVASILIARILTKQKVTHPYKSNTILPKHLESFKKRMFTRKLYF